MEVPGVKSMRGDGKLSGDGGVEYPCVRRLRHRRLISYLWLQGFKATHRSMLSETDAIFSVRRMEEFVLEGQWSDAYSYLCRFLPVNDTFRVPFSVEAQVLHRFVAIHKVLDNVIASTKEGDSAAAEFKVYLDHSRDVPYGTFRLRSIMFNVINSRQLLRTSFDLERVRRKALAIISDLIYQTPELRDLVFMPRGPMGPFHVLPIGFGFRRRSPRNKQARRPPASAVALIYLGKKKLSLPPSSSHSQDSLAVRSGRVTAIDWVADILDESFKAGKRPELHHTHPVQTTGKEGTHHVNLTSHAQSSGAAAAPLSTTFGTLTGSAKVPRMTSVANAVHLATCCHFELPELVEGVPVAQVARTTKVTSHAENPESVQQGFTPWKNPREVSYSVKQDLHPKRQRSAEDFGEASLMWPGTGGLAESLLTTHECS